MRVPTKFYNCAAANINHHPFAYTVGELIELLEELPPDMPIEQGFGEGCEVTVYNFDTGTEHVEFGDTDDY